MPDDYIWDKSGEPDREVERLERLLAPLGAKRPLRELQLPPERRTLWWLAAAAGVVLMAGGVWFYRNATRPSWEVASLSGRPQVDSKGIADKGRLPVGGLLQTDAASKAKISKGQIGEVEVEPNTRLRLLASKASEQRLGLDRGTIKVMIWAPPRQFYVNTPSATTVDLGCAYTLEVDESGTGMISVTAGWVAFEWQGRETFIPAGADCPTHAGSGPGTPHYYDASDAFRAALEKVDGSGDGDALGIVLREARQRDAFTLWHVLRRVAAEDRGRVYDRLAALVPPPAGVTREGIVSGNRDMMDQWWDALGLGDTTWWRMWKGAWPPK